VLVASPAIVICSCSMPACRSRCLLAVPNLTSFYQCFDRMVAEHRLYAESGWQLFRVGPSHVTCWVTPSVESDWQVVVLVLLIITHGRA
jgi:hypothetical protein